MGQKTILAISFLIKNHPSDRQLPVLTKQLAQSSQVIRIKQNRAARPLCFSDGASIPSESPSLGFGLPSSGYAGGSQSMTLTHH